jgi:hypothetical protein
MSSDGRRFSAAYTLNLADTQLNSVARLDVKDGQLANWNVLLRDGDVSYQAWDLNRDFLLDFRTVRRVSEGKVWREGVQTTFERIQGYPHERRSAPSEFLTERKATESSAVSSTQARD